MTTTRPLATTPYASGPPARRGHRLTIAGMVASMTLGLAAVAGPASAAPEGPGTSGHNVNAARAERSFAALQHYFDAGDGTGLYLEQYPVQADDPKYSYEWPFSQVHTAVLDLTGMSGGHSGAGSYLPSLAAHKQAQLLYWTEAGTTGLPGFASGVMPPLYDGGDLFYDDNEWVGLADIQHHRQHGDAASLTEARKIFDLVVSGWDTDPTHAAPGGVFWTQAPWSQDRNTVSNMPAAELGLRLYQLTHEQRYLEESLRFYSWTNEHLQRPDGLYNDNLKLDGQVDTTVWSYNQGVPIGVNVLLYEVTKDKHYLVEAQRIANAAYDRFVTGDRLKTQPVFFNSIFFKNLLLLSSARNDPRYRAALAAYADTVWLQNRDAATGLFHFDDSGRTQVIEQAAATQIFAVLAWSHADYSDLY